LNTPILGEKVPASVSARSRKAPARPSRARPRTGKSEVGDSRMPGDSGDVTADDRSLTVAARMGASVGGDRRVRRPAHRHLHASYASPQVANLFDQRVPLGFGHGNLLRLCEPRFPATGAGALPARKR